MSNAPLQTLTVEQHNALMRDALDHIRRAAQSSRTMTRRLDFIADRAIRAIKGKAYDPSAFDAPRIRTDEANQRRREDSIRYRKLRDRDQLTGVDFAIEDLTNKFGIDMDVLVDQLPPLPMPKAKFVADFYKIFPDTVTEKEPMPGIYWRTEAGVVHGPFKSYTEAKDAWRIEEGSDPA